MVTTAAVRVPPEIVDRIIDYAHDDPKTLIACSLVGRHWVPSSRLHLFADLKLNLLSTDEVDRLKEFIEFAPNLLPYCQELTIRVLNFLGDPSAEEYTTSFTHLLSTFHERIEALTSLHTLHIRGFRICPNEFFEFLLALSDKITTITFTSSNLESRHDLWKILRLFPNLQHVHVSDLGYSLNGQGQLKIPPECYRSPPIASFSIDTYCLGFVLQELAEPPYPLEHLESLGVYHTDQKQRHLNSVATKYRNAITTLRFGASSSLGSDIPPHIGIYNHLQTLILGKLDLFATFSGRSSHPHPSFAWVTATIPQLNSRLNRLVFEIAVTEKRDLGAICWQDIDTFLNSHERFENLESVEVVFLDSLPTKISTPWPEKLPPGIDLREDVMKEMWRTVARGQMKCSARGLRT